jgi:hypothetical protein
VEEAAPDATWTAGGAPGAAWTGGGAPGAAWPGGGDPPGVKAAPAGVFARERAETAREGRDFSGGFLFPVDRFDRKAQHHGGEVCQAGVPRWQNRPQNHHRGLVKRFREV